MSRRTSFAESEFANKKQVRRKEALLAGMELEQVVAWKRLVERLEPFCPKVGRPPVGLERVWRRRRVVQKRWPRDRHWTALDCCSGRFIEIRMSEVIWLAGPT